MREGRGVQEQGRRSLGMASLKVLGFLVLTALLAVLVVIQQRASGAYLAEFSATQASEARHFVSGLAVADYLGTGAPAPGPFLQDYVLRFPAFDPADFFSLYYVVEGLWVSAFTPATPSVLLLSAFLAALLVVGAGWVAGQALGALLGVTVGALMIAAPPLREASVVVGLDLPMALFALAAALAYGAYLIHGRRRDALLFTLAAAGAVLTEPAGLALVLLPPFALLLSGRWRLLRSASFWLPLVALGLLAAPQLLASGAPGRAFPSVVTPQALASRLDAVGAGIGGAFLVFAGIGAIFASVRRWRGASSASAMVGLGALAAALLTGVALGLVAEPPIVPLLAPVMALAAYGLMSLLGLLSSDWATIRALVAMLILLAAGMPGQLQQVRKAPVGMDEAAQDILARDQAQPVVMVGADEKGEAALIAAMAQHDRGRRSYVVPASRQTALTATAPDRGAVLARLDGLAVSFLVLDTSPAAQARPATRALMAIVEADPDRFGLLGTFPRRDGAGEVRVYAVDGHGDVPIAPADMKRRLGGTGAQTGDAS